MLNLAFDIIWYPFRNLNPVWGLISISILIGIFSSLIYRFTANQRAIKKIKSNIKGYMLELIIFDYSPFLIINSLFNIFNNFFKYLKYSFKSIIFLIVPITFVLIKLHYIYDYMPFKPGDRTVVTLKLQKNIDREINLLTSQNIQILPPPVYISKKNEVSWKVLIKEYGKGKLTFNVEGRTYEKDIIISNNKTKVTPLSISGSFFSQFKNVGSTFFHNDEIIKSVSIEYPEDSFHIFDFEIHWLVIFLLFSVITGAVFMKIYGIQW